MDKKIEELLEKGKELKTQGSEILKKEKKTVSRAFHAWKDMDHHKGDVHTGELTTAFREWRGVKDTAYDFAKWLQVWGDMSLMIMKNPVGSVKGLWKYRWFSSYLQTPMFIDAQLTGLRGPQLRIAREHMRMIVRFCTRLLENTFKADENLNGPNALSDKIVLFDEMMPIHIMAGFPNLIGMPSQMAPVYITSLLDQQMQVHYLDETENYGLPADVCPLPSAEAGCGIAGDYPIFGKCYITSSMPCDGSVMTNIFQDRYFKLPTYPLTLPVRYLDEQAVDYAVEEIKGMIRFIEENTGETFDWDAYFEAMERYNKETEYEQEKWDVNQTAYPQITGSILAIYRELSYMADAGRDPRFLKTDERVNKIMMKAYREKNPCTKEMRHRAVVWSCPAHYYANFGNWAEQCWGIDVLIDMESMMSMKFINTEDKEESLKDIAWTYERMAMRKHTNGGYANVLDELWKVCEEFHADMVIMYSHISCKTMAGLQGLFDDQARERGIRFIWVEHDLMDPRTVSRRHMRESVNRYMRTVMHEEPVDPSLEDFDDEKEW